MDNSENNEPSGLALMGNRKGFELLNELSNEHQQVLSLQTGDVPSAAQELWEDDRMELLVTHSCTSVFLREVDGIWQSSREIQWNCQPVSVVPAFPYILALSADSMEIRSPVNGTLLQTLNLPKLKLLSSKDDIYFTTTKQVHKSGNRFSLILSQFCRATTYEKTAKWNPCPSFATRQHICIRYHGMCWWEPVPSTDLMIKTTVHPLHRLHLQLKKL